MSSDYSYKPIWVTDTDNIYPNEPYGNPFRRFKALYVYNGLLVYTDGNSYYYKIRDAFNDEVLLDIQLQTYYGIGNTYGIKLFDGDYSALSPEGQARAGYVSPETLANQAATVTNSISRLKSKVKKPILTSEETEPLIEEDPKP